MRLFLMTIFSSLFLLSCFGKKKEIIYTGQSASGKMQVTLLKTANPLYPDAPYLSFKINDLPAFRLFHKDDANPKFFPYDWRLLDGITHTVWHKDDVTFIKDDTDPEPSKKWNVLIFIDPKQYDAAAYKIIENVLQEQLPDFENKLYKEYITGQMHFNYPRFAGIVYTADPTFPYKFFNDVNEHEYIEVAFTGEVAMSKTDNMGSYTESTYGRATTKMQPFFNPASDSLLQQLSHYKLNKSGKSLIEAYDIYIYHDSEINRDMVGLIPKN